MHFNFGLKARRLSVETCWSAISTFSPFEWSRLFVILFLVSASWHRLTTTPPPPPPAAASPLNMLYALCVYNIYILYIYTVLCIQAVLYIRCIYYIQTVLYIQTAATNPLNMLRICLDSFALQCQTSRDRSCWWNTDSETINQLILQFEHGIQILARSVLLKISRWGKKKEFEKLWSNTCSSFCGARILSE